MKGQKVLAISLISLFLCAGCLGMVEPDGEVPDVALPDNWAEIPARSIGAPQLQAYDDCEDLERSLKSSIEEEYRVQLLQAAAEEYYYGGGMWMEDDMELAADTASNAEGGGAAQPRTTPARVEGEDYSGTNNQESGVDEADFVKTDGYNIYYLQGQKLHIFGVPEYGQLTDLSNTTVEGTPQAMMLDGDQLVVISTLSAWELWSKSVTEEYSVLDNGDFENWRTSSLTKFTVYDVNNRSEPDIEREVYIEGTYITAREVNGTVRTVSHAWMDVQGLQTWLDLPTGYWNLVPDDPIRKEIREKVAWQTIQDNREALTNLALEDLLPQVYEYRDGLRATHKMTDGECADFVAPKEGFSRGISSIFSLDLTASEFDFEVDHVVGTYPQVYASQDLLVLAEGAFDWWWFWGNDEANEMTNLHTFDISGETTLYTGSGRINGTVVNQFALSEYEGVLRVATTVGQWARWWMEDPEPMTSQLVTLVRSMDVETQEQILVEAGRVDNIAPGERIWSARFDGDRAYIVTFEQIDPLWVIDVSDETQPTILGELEVPGVSTYIHPLSRDHLLTIGLSPANEDGTGLDWSGTQISLFNITDPTTPSRDAALRLSPVNDGSNGWVWSWSEATYESKAFQYWAPKELLAIPLSTYRYVDYEANGRYYWSYDYVSKLMLVHVNQSTGNLSVYGSVDHSDLYTQDENNRWWNENNIRRAIFMGDYVYAISSAGVTATNLTTLEETARVQIPPEVSYYGGIVYSDATEEGDRDDSSGEERDEREGSTASSS